MASRSPQTPGKGALNRDANVTSPAGWGKQATKRFNTTDVFKKDPLLKSLEGKIAVGFGDYKPWQRTSLPRYVPPIKSVESTKPRKGKIRPISSHTTQSTFSVGTSKDGQENDRAFSGTTLHTQCSSVCLHPWLKKPVINNYVFDKKRQKIISIMKMQIKMRQKSLQEYRKRKIELLEDNFSLKDQIESSEVEVHDDVKFLLQKYEKFRGALATLNKTFDEDLTVAKKELNHTKQKVDKEIGELQHQLDVMDSILQSKLDKANVLLNYKDKEYPEKALEIAKLKRRKELLKNTFKEELEELHAVISAEMSKFSEKTKNREIAIREKVTEDTIASMDQKVKDMALQNMIMKKEIDIHKNEVKNIESENTNMEKDIQTLLSSQELNTKAQLFPDIFGERLKCTPDMDVVLDIPTHQWLPL